MAGDVMFDMREVADELKLDIADVAGVADVFEIIVIGMGSA